MPISRDEVPMSAESSALVDPTGAALGGGVGAGASGGPWGRMFRYRGAYFADSSVVIGDVAVGEDSSFWPFTCARGDVAPIRVGRRVSVQDFTMLHCKHQIPLTIEDHVVIGHHACVHCTRVGAWSLIGIGSRVLDECEIGEWCIVAAGAVLAPGTKVPSGKVIAGVPGKILRDVNDRDRAYIKDVSNRYVLLAQSHHQGEFPSIFPPHATTST